MAYTSTDIANLKAAIASGAMRMRYADGREVQFRSLDEMNQILRTMEAEVGGSSSSDTPSRSFVVGF